MHPDATGDRHCSQPADPCDTIVAHPARVYGYWLGREDHLAPAVGQPNAGSPSGRPFCVIPVASTAVGPLGERPQQQLSLAILHTIITVASRVLRSGSLSLT